MPDINRPLSPHLTIYRKQISSVLSILHRVTGVALYAGTPLLALWLWSAAYRPEYFAQLHECLVSPIGQFCLFGWLWSFFYHFGNGIRHLFWDAGYGFQLPTMHRTGWAVVVFSFAMTLFVWGYAHA